MDEDKQGVYASSALAGVLVVLSLLLLGVVGQYGLVGDLREVSDERSEEGSGKSSGGGGLSDSSEELSAGSASVDELRAATTEYFESLNYEGSDGDEFMEQIEPTVVEGSFYGSSAGEMVEYLAEELDEGGLTRTEYELTDFEAQSAGRDEATVVVELDSSWYEDGEIASRLVTSEEVSLADTEDGWKVAGAKVIETLEDAQAGAEPSGGSGEGLGEGSEEAVVATLGPRQA